MKRRFVASIVLACIVMCAWPSICVPVPGRDQPVDAWINDSPSWPGLVQHAPIVATSDGDLAALAMGGTGVIGDPYILENMVIECNSTGSGIIVMNTGAYTLIRNSFINESGPNVGAFDSGILLNNADNIVIQNVTVEHAALSDVAIAYSEGVTVVACTLVNATLDGLVIANCTNVNVTSSTFDDNTSRDLEISASFDPCYDITIDTNTFSSYITYSNVYINKVYRGLEFINNNCQNNNTLLDGAVYIKTSNGTVAGNSIGTLGNIGDVGIHIESAGDMLVENNTIADFLDQALIIGKSDLSINSTCNVRNNTILGSFNSNIAKGISDLSNYSTFVGNTLINLSYAFSIEGANHVTYANNTFSNNNVSIRFMDVKNVNLTFTGNNFTDDTLLWSPAITVDSERIFTGNWIDVDAINSTSIIYPTVDWTFDQNYYRDYFDRFPFAVTDNVSTSILEFDYELIAGINDTRPAYYAAWFPRGDTETAFYIASSIDDMGVTFEWFKLYVNSIINVRQYATPQYVLFRVTVKDFANRVLYDRMHNVNASLSVEINLPITTLIVQNNFACDVLFQITRLGKTTTFAIASGDSFQLRVVTGTYYYRVTDASGHVLDDVHGDAITGYQAVSGPTVIAFGWTTASPDPVPDGPTWVDLIWPVLIMVAIIEILIRIPFRSKNARRSTSSTPYARPRR